MIVPDVNVLIQAMDPDSPHHDRAWPWWDHAMRGSEHIGFAWSVMSGYLRITTNPRVMPLPLGMSEAASHVRDWLALPRAIVLQPGVEHVHVMEQLLDSAGRAGDLVPDAHLAALAFEHGGTVYSQDADFARFRGIRWVDPTA